MTSPRTRRLALAPALAAAALAAIAFAPGEARAGMTLSASWNDSGASLGLEKQRTTSVNGSVSVDLFDHLQIGVTGRKDTSVRKGLKRVTSSDGSQYVYMSFLDESEIITTSADLTLVLYNGAVSPFVFGGVARREYTTKIAYPEYNLSQTSKDTLPHVPNGGFGLAVYLGRGFSLKATQTYTEGIQARIEAGKRIEKKVYDAYTTVGLSYRI